MPELKREFYGEELPPEVGKSDTTMENEVNSGVPSQSVKNMFDFPQLEILKKELKAELKSELLSTLKAELKSLIPTTNKCVSVKKFVKEELRSNGMVWQLANAERDGENNKIKGDWSEQDMSGGEDITCQLIKRKGVELPDDYNKRSKYERGRRGQYGKIKRNDHSFQRVTNTGRSRCSSEAENPRRPLSQENGSCQSKEFSNSTEDGSTAQMEERPCTTNGGFRGRGGGGYRGRGGFQARGGFRGRGGFQSRGGYRGRGGGFQERGGGGGFRGRRQGSSSSGGEMRAKRNFRWRGGTPEFKENRNLSSK